MVRYLDIYAGGTVQISRTGMAAGFAVIALVIGACQGDDNEGVGNAQAATSDTVETDVEEDISDTEEDSWEGVGEGMPEPPSDQEATEDEGAGEAPDVPEAPEGCVLDSTLVICPDAGQEDAPPGSFLEATYFCKEGWSSTQMPSDGEISGPGWNIKFTPEEPDGLRIQVSGDGRVFRGVISEDGTFGANIVRLEGNEDWDNVAFGDYGDTITVCQPD